MHEMVEVQHLKIFENFDLLGYIKMILSIPQSESQGEEMDGL